MRTAILLFSLVVTITAQAAEPIKPIARRIPPVGNDIGKANRAKIQTRLDEVTKAFNNLSQQKLADVDIYIKAVRYALLHDEIYAKGDIEKSLRLLDTAEQRIRALANGQHPWTTQRGKLVRGYYSDIDGSPQPYGLEIPEKLEMSRGKKVPLYVWLHGRGDKTTDMHFIAQREKGGCPISSHVDDGIILHPFGRHCVGYKGPGEIDVLDAIASVKERYNIDEDRVALLGFSMGGAGAWHIGAHYADQFCVVHAGAGFAETKEYTGLKKVNYPPIYEQKLWGLYDVPNYTRNLFNTTVIAYSGEKDKQIQAARVMERAFKAEGRTLQHIIGPGMGHKYHPESLKQIMTVVKAAVKKGRNKWPKEVFLQTQTTRYNKMHWVRINELTEHWQDSRLHAVVTGAAINIQTTNVSYFSISPPRRVFGNAEAVSITIDDNSTTLLPIEKFKDGAHIGFRKSGNNWRVILRPVFTLGVKSNHWSGPIDDIVMSPFLVIEPTGESQHPAIDRWTKFELEHFKNRWRALYRGDLRTRKDTLVTNAELQKFNLIAWGDHSSNSWIKKNLRTLPFVWDDKVLAIKGYDQGQPFAHGTKFDAATHVPLSIQYSMGTGKKNGKTTVSKHYIALNAGITHREAHDRTNSLQNPKLPDWAIISLEKDPDAESAGVVKAAGFFGENWQVKK